MQFPAFLGWSYLNSQLSQPWKSWETSLGKSSGQIMPGGREGLHSNSKGVFNSPYTIKSAFIQKCSTKIVNFVFFNQSSTGPTKKFNGMQVQVECLLSEEAIHKHSTSDIGNSRILYAVLPAGDSSSGSGRPSQGRATVRRHLWRRLVLLHACL